LFPSAFVGIDNFSTLFSLSERKMRAALNLAPGVVRPVLQTPDKHSAEHQQPCSDLLFELCSHLQAMAATLIAE
jgi:hypothetical protein